MSIIIREGRVIIPIPGVTFIGEQFNLPESHFAPGSVGAVEKILGQGGGQTKVKMKIVQGRALSRSARRDQVSQQQTQQRAYQDPYGEQHARPPIPPELQAKLNERPRDRFERGSEKIVQEGGKPHFANFDPRPRSGQNNQIVQNSPIDQHMMANQQSGMPFDQVTKSITTPIQQAQPVQVWNPQVAAQNITQQNWMEDLNAGAPGDPTGEITIDPNTGQPVQGKRGGYRRSDYQDRWQGRDQYGRLQDAWGNTPPALIQQQQAQQQAQDPNMGISHQPQDNQPAPQPQQQTQQRRSSLPTLVRRKRG